MAITIERLPDLEDLEKEISIIVGKNVVFKIYPHKSIFDSNSELQKLILKQDLCKRENFEKIKEINRLSEERKSLINECEKRKTYLKELLSREEKDIRNYIISMESKDQKERNKLLTRIDTEIKKILDFFEVKLTNRKYFCFCDKCSFLVKEGGIESPQNCSVCGNKVTLDSNKDFNIIENQIEEYLRGDWMADYIGKAFKKKDWKVWTNLDILGSSGIPHEIDLLCINKNGFILIGECKTGNIKRENVFTFSTKCNDLSNAFSCFFTMKKIPEDQTREFMEKTKMIHFEDIPSKTEKEFFEEIFIELND